MNNSLFFSLLLLLTISIVNCDKEDEVPDKEKQIDCVNDCGETVEEWKACAVKCYGDKMDESDRTFLACETDCVDRFYKPNVDEAGLGDLEQCAEKCIEKYRGES